MSTPDLLHRTVWVLGGEHGTWSPGGFYHLAAPHGWTHCGISTFGRGYTTSEDEARDDWRAPCPTCHGTEPAPTQMTDDLWALLDAVAARQIYRSTGGADKRRMGGKNPARVVTAALRLLADEGWVCLGLDGRTWRLTTAGRSAYDRAVKL